MSSEELLYTNKFISPDVDGLENERTSLLNYLDQIDSEKQNIENQHKDLKEKLKNSAEYNTNESKKYKETIVNIDSRYRQKDNLNVKNQIVNTFTNTIYNSTNAINEIHILAPITPIITPKLEFQLINNLHLTTTEKLWMTIEKTNYDSTDTLDIQQFQNKRIDISSVNTRYVFEINTDENAIAENFLDDSPLYSYYTDYDTTKSFFKLNNIEYKIKSIFIKEAVNTVRIETHTDLNLTSGTIIKLTLKKENDIFINAINKLEFPIKNINTLYFFEIDTISDNNLNSEFKYNNINGTDTNLLKFDDTPGVLSSNTFFYINLFTLTNQTDKLQITHMQHPYNNGDNISMSLDWKTTLSRTGGLISKIYYTNNEDIRIYHDGNDEYYMNQFFNVGDNITVNVDFLDNGIITPKKGILQIKTLDITIQKITSLFGETDHSEVIPLNEFDTIHTHKYYITCKYDSTLDIDKGLNNVFTTPSITKRVLNSINNYWTKEVTSNDQQLFTVKHSPNVYLYYPNHGFTTPFNISGNILKIQAFNSNLPTTPIAFSNLTNPLTINDGLIFYTDNIELKENMQVYITVSSNNSTTTGSILELNHNPYTIREIEQYVFIDTLDRDVIPYEIIEQFDNHDRQYNSSFTSRYNHEKISNNRFNKIYYKFTIRYNNGNSTSELSNDIFPTLDTSEIFTTYSYDPVADYKNVSTSVYNTTPHRSDIICSFSLDDPSLTHPNEIDNNYQVEITNLNNLELEIKKIEILRPLCNSTVIPLENYISNIEYISGTNLSLYYEKNRQIHTHKTNSYLFVDCFRITFLGDNNFDIRNYYNLYISLNLNKYINDEKNNGPFEIVNLIRKKDILITEGEEPISQYKYKTFSLIANGTTYFLNGQSELDNKTIIIKFRTDKWLGGSITSINDNTEIPSIEKEYSDNSIAFITTTVNSYWQPSDYVWLRIFINKQNFPKLTNLSSILSNELLTTQDLVKLKLYLDELDDYNIYKVYNIHKDENADLLIFDINTKKTNLNLISKTNTKRTCTILSNGGFNKSQIENKHPIYIVNSHICYIKLNNNSHISYYFGSNPLLSTQSPIIKKLAIGNISEKYIDADYPVTVNRMNGYHKIIYINKNNYQINTKSSPLVAYDPNENINNPIYVNISSIDKINDITVDTQKINKIMTGYKYQHHYIYEFGRIFEQIVKIELISSEFPNSNQIIKNFPENEANNILYFRLIDDGDYIYKVVLDPGNYSAISLKVEMQDKMNGLFRSYDREEFLECIISINSSKSKIEFRLFDRIGLSDALSINKGSNRLEILFENKHELKDNDLIILSHVNLNGINSPNLNKQHYVKIISEYKVYVILTISSRSTIINEGGELITLRKLIPFQILWNKPNSFGDILGFNYVNDNNLYYQPPYMSVVSNYEYNKYNNTNSPSIFNISGEPYILMINELLSNVDNNSNVKNIFAKILLSTRAGSFSFNSHIASPTTFYNPLKKLSSLEFKFLNFNGEYFNFNDIDHSFSLKITELIDNNTIKSISSRRNN